MSTGAFVQAAWSRCNFVLKRVALPHPNDWTADVGDEVKDGVGLEAGDEGGEKQRRGEDLIVGRGKRVDCCEARSTGDFLLMVDR